MLARWPRLSRFSLRTLVVFVTLLATGLGCVGRQYQNVRERRAVRVWMAELLARDKRLCQPAEGELIVFVDNLELPWLHRALGEFDNFEFFPYPPNEADRARLFAAFPNAEVFPWSNEFGKNLPSIED